MKKIAIFALFVLVLVLGTGSALGVNDKQTDTKRIVIGLASPNAKADVLQAVQSNGGIFVREMLDGALIFNIPDAALGKLKSHPQILENADYLEEDIKITISDPKIGEVTGIDGIQLTPDDPLYPQQWGMPMIGANKAWDILVGDPQMIVAVIDTGVYYNHEDLAAVNEALGYDFVNDDSDANDDNGHGTHVAGIIAATMNNGKGVAGVAPGITVMPVKVLDSRGSGWVTDIADGIIWAADHGAKILSMSLGAPTSDRWTSDATKYAVYTRGALVIASSGNSGKEAPNYPAAYSWVLSVGALDSAGRRASYSQYGSWLDLMAPGSSVISTVPTGVCELCDPSGYEYLSGTSMAAPHASGVAALYWSYKPGATNKQIASMLINNADDLGTPGWDKYYGHGRVDAYPMDG